MSDINNIIDALNKDASKSMRKLVDLDYNYVDYDHLSSIYGNRLYTVKGIIDFLNEPGFKSYRCEEVKNKLFELIQAILDSNEDSDFPTNLINKFMVIQELIKNDFNL